MAEVIESEIFSRDRLQGLAWNEGHAFRYSEFIGLEIPYVDSTFQACAFRDCSSYWTLFNMVLFLECRFENCTFQGATFAGCRFIECSFESCSFVQDNMGGECDFTGTVQYASTATQCVGLESLIP